MKTYKMYASMLVNSDCICCKNILLGCSFTIITNTYIFVYIWNATQRLTYSVTSNSSKLKFYKYFLSLLTHHYRYSWRICHFILCFSLGASFYNVWSLCKNRMRSVLLHFVFHTEARFYFFSHTPLFQNLAILLTS